MRGAIAVFPMVFYSRTQILQFSPRNRFAGAGSDITATSSLVNVAESLVTEELQDISEASSRFSRAGVFDGNIIDINGDNICDLHLIGLAIPNARSAVSLDLVIG